MIEQIWDMTRLGDQAMESHYVNVDSVTQHSSNSIVFLNCISQLYVSIVFLNCISQLYFSTVYLNCMCQLYFFIVFPKCISQLYFSVDQQAMESHYVNVDSVTRRSPIHPSQSNESTTMFFLHHNNHPFILCCNIYPSNHPRSNDDTIRPCLISNSADNDVVKGNVTQYTRPRNRFTLK